jgi:hypothetical protein
MFAAWLVVLNRNRLLREEIIAVRLVYTAMILSLDKKVLDKYLSRGVLLAAEVANDCQAPQE